MNRTKRQIAIAAAVPLSALALAACGGSGAAVSSSASTTQAPEQQQAAHNQVGGQRPSSNQAVGQSAHSRHQDHFMPRPHHDSGGGTAHAFTPRPHHDSGGGAAQFETKGADNSIQESGSEASEAELAQAAAALHGYLDARAAGAWSAACSYMAPAAAAGLAELTGASGQGQPSCAQLLAAVSGGLPAAVLREAAVADVGSLRVEGSGGFLLFHGARHGDYFMPMASEGGEWKVAAIAPSALG